MTLGPDIRPCRIFIPFRFLFGGEDIGIEMHDCLDEPLAVNIAQVSVKLLARRDTVKVSSESPLNLGLCLHADKLVGAQISNSPRKRFGTIRLAIRCAWS